MLEVVVLDEADRLRKLEGKVSAQAVRSCTSQASEVLHRAVQVLHHPHHVLVPAHFADF